MKSSKTWLGVVAALVLVTAFGVYGPYQWQTERRRDAAVTQIRNLATRQVNARPYIPSLQSRDEQTPSEAKPKNTDWQNLIRGVKVLPSKQELWAGAAAFSHLWYDHRILTPEEYTQLEYFFDQSAEMLSEIHRLGAMAGTAFGFDDLLAWQKRDKSISASGYSNGYSLVLADAYVQSKRSAGDLVIQDFTTAIRLANLYLQSSDPLAREQLIASYREFFYVVQAALEAGCMSSEQIGAALALLPAANGRELFADSLIIQARNGVDYFDAIRQGQSKRDPGYWLWFDRAYGTRLARPVFNMDESVYADMMLRIAQLGPLPFYQAKPELERCDREIAGMFLKPYTCGHLQPPSWLLTDQAIYEATLDLTKMGLKLEQYRLEHGDYPNLPELALNGAALPVDPFTGAPYLYRVSDEEILLYSVGYNLRDDNGVYELDWLNRFGDSDAFRKRMGLRDDGNYTSTVGMVDLYCYRYCRPIRKGQEGYAASEDSSKDDVVWRVARSKQES